MDANCEIAFVEADEPKMIKDADRSVYHLDRNVWGSHQFGRVIPVNVGSRAHALHSGPRALAEVEQISGVTTTFPQFPG
jgi:hypothetical protein